jgi:gluconokinase
MSPTVLVVTGVAGSGKTTVGLSLAQRLGWDFKEGDELHTAANVAKMREGNPLGDLDRAPWLAAVATWIDDWLRHRVRGVITCSALKKSYRQCLVRGRPAVCLIFLEARPAILVDRLARRQGHFLPPSLLESQLATLEKPTPHESVIRVDADQSPVSQVEVVINAMTALERRASSTGQT